MQRLPFIPRPEGIAERANLFLHRGTGIIRINNFVGGRSKEISSDILVQSVSTGLSGDDYD